MSGLAAASVRSKIQKAVPQLDEDSLEYILGLIEEAGKDIPEETKEAVEALISGAGLEDDALRKASDALWASLLSGGGVVSEKEEVEVLRKLEKSVKISDDDVAAQGKSTGIGVIQFTFEEEALGANAFGGSLGVAAFFANQIGIRTEAAISEKNRRKEMQRRLKREDEERQRADELEHQIKLNQGMGEEDGDDDLAVSKDAEDHQQDIHIRNFNLPNKRGSGGDLLQGANLTLSRGRRYGLLGRNGCGKSTLLELIAKREVKGVPKSMSILLVRQETVASDSGAVDTVLKSDLKREGLLAFIKIAEASGGDEHAAALSRAYQELQILEDSQGPPEPRARSILAGLGFTEAMMSTPTKHLSGGWRMRVSLATALFCSPSFLMLDEPTNHLDIESVLWLENYLVRKFSGTLLVVSHDRSFLNEIVTDIAWFNNQKLTTYKGDIDTFEEVLEEERKNQIRLRKKQEEKREKMESYIKLHGEAGENGPKAAAQRKQKIKKMERLGVDAVQGRKFKLSYDTPAEEVEEVREVEDVTLDFPDPGVFDGPIIVCERASFGYGQAKDLISEVDLVIDQKSRIAIFGRNGSGKSTLIKGLTGQLGVRRGKCVVSDRARIEFLAQHQLEQLDPTSCALETMIERYPGDGSTAHIQKLRNHLAKFGMGGDVLPEQSIATLSGGQRCRICLAAAFYRMPHLVIFDEPTNHLDLESIEALIEALDNFKGGVVIVSHDETLLKSVAKDMFVVFNGKVEKLRDKDIEGDAFVQYKKDVRAGRK